MPNKKASVEYYFLLFIVIAVSFYIFLATVPQSPMKLTRQIGDAQLPLLKAYDNAEELLFYLDLSAKYSAYNALYELAKNGGFADESACGSYLGYNLLNDKEGYCNEDAIEHFKLLFDNYLSLYLNRFPNIELSNDLYEDYIIKENNDVVQLYGLPKNNIKLDVWTEKAESFIKEVKEEAIEKKAQIVTGECNEIPPVELGFVEDKKCDSENCYIRNEVKERLDLAREKSKKFSGDIGLNSGWRSLCAQALIYKEYGPERAAEKGKSPHHSGGAVDISITGNELYCGKYSIGEKTIKGIYIKNIGDLYAFRDIPTEEGQKIHNCRMTLREIMESSGFHYPPLTGEWWHWEYGTIKWANANNQDVKFDLVLI